MNMSPSVAFVWLPSPLLYFSLCQSWSLTLSPLSSQLSLFLRGFSIVASHKLWSLEEVTLVYAGSKCRPYLLVQVVLSLWYYMAFRKLHGTDRMTDRSFSPVARRARLVYLKVSRDLLASANPHLSSFNVENILHREPLFLCLIRLHNS